MKSLVLVLLLSTCALVRPQFITRNNGQIGGLIGAQTRATGQGSTTYHGNGAYTGLNSKLVKPFTGQIAGQIYSSPISPIRQYGSPVQSVQYAPAQNLQSVHYTAPANVHYTSPANVQYSAPAHTLQYSAPAHTLQYSAPAQRYHSVQYQAPAQIQYSAPAQTIQYSAPVQRFQQYSAPAQALQYSAIPSQTYQYSAARQYASPIQYNQYSAAKNFAVRTSVPQVAAPIVRQSIAPAQYNVATRTQASASPAILRQSQQVNFDGTYDFGFESEDGISVQSSGVVKALGPEEAGQTAQGSYSYTAPDGTPISATWYADETGFHIEGAHIPTDKNRSA